jgi:DNA-directed RNA polymerase specialized sigma24 family protein
MLELLAQKHNTWLRMVMSFGSDYDTAQDIVQSMYLRMHKYVKDEERIMYNDDEINRFFVYVTLKNMYFTYVKSNSKYSFFDIWEHEGADEFVEEVFDHAMDIAFEKLVHSIHDEMKSWHRYDRILSEKYLKSDYSLRDIATGSGISLTSIFNSMRENKRILKEKFSEDWEDFKNGDYNLI